MLVQAGVLDRLVTISAHGLQNVSVSVTDDNGEMSLREGKTRELVVDRVEFARVWWSSFRSFVTPLVFFEVREYLYWKVVRLTILCPATPKIIPSIATSISVTVS